MIPHFPSLFAAAILDEVTKPREITGLVGGSSFGPKADMCMKKLQFLTLRTPMSRSAPPLGLCLTLFRGTVLDSLIKRLSAKLGLPLEPDVYGKVEDLMLGGTLDFLLHLPEEDGGLTVVELKSIHPDLYRFQRAPQRKHLYQVAHYMLITGAAQAIVYYVPWGTEPSSDPVSTLKKAIRGASGELQREIEALVNKYGHLTASKEEERELGRQYLVPRDEKLIAEIREAMLETQHANQDKRWLPMNMTQCQLCPFTKPCLAGVTVASADARQELEAGSDV